MRRPAFALLLLAGSPALAAGQQCAPPRPITMASADPAPVTPGPAVDVTDPAQPPRALPSDLAALPFVKHVADAGANILDLGATHGLRLIGARSGTEFRVFSVLQDGQAAIEGAPIAVGVAQLTKLAEGAVTPLGTRLGVNGLFVRSGRRFQVFYAAPDGEVVIPGILRTAEGKDVTREQVRDIPGVVPTVEVADGPTRGPGDRTQTPGADGEAALNLVSQTRFGTIGPESAPQVFMMIDPQCIYSVRAYQQLRGYADAGKIRLAIVPIAILDHEDAGQSTRSALALLSKPPTAMAGAWQSGDVNGAVAAQAQDLLRRNMAVAEAIGLKGTPTFVWRRKDGQVGRIDGVPTDIGALLASVGS